MPVLNKLVKLYHNEGFQISTGLNPCHFENYPLASFTRLIRDGESQTNGLGIAMQEVYFLECLFDGFQPQNIFIIGNSFGWSTLALGLLNPEAQIIAIDSGYDAKSIEGIKLTNKLAEKAGLSRLKVIRGASPQDVSPIIEKELGGKVDFAFIDGLHTNEQIVLDFNAIKAYGTDDSVYLFHDIHEFDLYQGFETIAQHPDYQSRILMGTPSGVGLVYPNAAPDHIYDTVETFSLSTNLSKVIEQEVWGWKHRHLKRYKNSIQKRVKKLNALLGR